MTVLLLLTPVESGWYNEPISEEKHEKSAGIKNDFVSQFPNYRMKLYFLTKVYCQRSN